MDNDLVKRVSRYKSMWKSYLRGCLYSAIQELKALEYEPYTVTMGNIVIICKGLTSSGKYVMLDIQVYQWVTLMGLHIDAEEDQILEMATEIIDQYLDSLNAEFDWAIFHNRFKAEV